MATISDLLSCVPAPEYREQHDWSAIDAELGFSTPQDYRAIIDTYGCGRFDDFLVVLVPEQSNKYLDLKSQIEIRRQALRDLADVEFIPHPIEMLTACAYTDNGDVIYWLANDSEPPSDWVVVINAARDDEWNEFNGNLLELLVALYNRTYVSTIFPDDFPDPGGSHFTRSGSSPMQA